MMKTKRPVDPRRLRKAPPRGFGWIDHRLLADGYFERLSTDAAALYCLLVCAADSQGLSYYSDRRLCALLGLDTMELAAARRELIEQGLLAYCAPLSQILALEGFEAEGWRERRRAGAQAAKLPAQQPPGGRPVPVAGQTAVGRIKPEIPADGRTLREMLRASLEGRTV